MQEILKRIVPGPEERKQFITVTNIFLDQLNSNLKDAYAILGGSGAKDSWLSGNHDADIFVQFDYQKHQDQSHLLSDLLEKTLQKTFPKIDIERVHGSRDYFQLTYKKLAFEVVPILKINKAEEALNITDISPLHALWINKHTKNIKDDIRLIKQFCKANSLYGAESYISGFSGYMLEIMIAYYGSFKKLLTASLKWKVKEVIDPEKYYRKNMVEFHLNKSKLQSPLIIIDPVDKNRNAAAALSKSKFLLFKKLAQQYLEHPDAHFFVIKKIDLAELKKEAIEKNQTLVFLTVFPLDGKRDVVGSKLLKAFQFIKKELDRFAVKKSAWEWEGENNAIFYFILGKDKLPTFEIRQGPPLSFKEAVVEFRKKNKECYVEKDRLMAKVKLKDPQLSDFLKNLLKDDYLKDKFKQVQVKE